MWRSLPALLFGIVLALALDQAIRWFLPPPTTEDRHWYVQTVRYHPLLGWSGRPDFVGTKDGIPIRTNSRGYRDREPADAENDRTRGVLFLGDSFTWGDEVRQEDRYTSLLEASCGAACDRLPPIRAINKGIIGYGTAQSLLDYLLTPDKRPFDVVILALYAGNDLTDNGAVDSPSGPRPRLIRCDHTDAGHGLCLEGVPVPSIVDWPEHRLIDPRGAAARTLSWSGLMEMASQRRAPRFLLERRIAGQMGDSANALPFPIVERTSAAPVADRIGQLESILRAMQQTVRGDDKAFGVMLFPSAKVYAGDPERELREYGEILRVVDRLRIPFVDYYDQTKGSRLDDLYSGIQGHWRPSGHEQAARLLRSLIVTLAGAAGGAQR